jgi:hypothetical protein
MSSQVGGNRAIAFSETSFAPRKSGWKAPKETHARADRKIATAECEVWSARMEGYGEPAQPSPTIEQAIGCGFLYLEVKCRRCNHRGAVDLRLLRRYPSTEIWRLEASLSCDHCREGHRGEAPVKMIKLSGEPDTSSPWYPPDALDGH